MDAGTSPVSPVIICCVATSITCSWRTPRPSGIRITISYVRIGVTSRRWWRASVVRIVAIRFSSRRRRCVRVPSWRCASSIVSSAIIVIRSSTRGTLSIVTTRTVTPGRRTAAIIVFVCTRSSVTATWWCALTITFVHRTLVLNLGAEMHEKIVRITEAERESSTNVLGAVYNCVLELTAVKLLHCGFQVGAVFEFDEAERCASLAARFATEVEWLTLCHHGRDQSRSRQRRLELGEQNLSDPRSIVSWISERLSTVNWCETRRRRTRTALKHKSTCTPEQWICYQARCCDSPTEMLSRP